MQEEQKKPVEAPAHAMAGKAPTVYDSNPFTSGWSAIQKLIKTNTHTVIGVALFNILLFVLLGVTVIAIAFTVVAFGIQHFATDIPGDVASNPAFEMFKGLSDGSIYATWVIGVAALIFVATLLQTLVLNLSVGAARGVTFTFGTLLKAAVRTVLPVLGLAVLAILAVLAVTIVIGLLAAPLGPIVMLVVLLAAIAAVYLALRLAYASYAIVDLHLGPIASLKHSWKISRGHLIETLGSSAVASLITTVPSLVLTALARVTESTGAAAVFGLIEFVAMLVLIVLTSMPLAERYVQIQAVADKKLTAAPLSPMNYLAILLVIVLAPIMNAISPAPTMDGTNVNQFEQDLNQSLPTTNDNSTYQLN
jgi:hypothetical protein